MGRALMRCLRHAGPYDSERLISPNHPKFGYCCGVPMSEAGWVNITDIIDKLWGSYTFKSIGELLSNLLLPQMGREEKRRAQVAVLVRGSNGELVRHALVRAITGHSIPGVNPDKLSAAWRESTCGLCAGIFHRTTHANLLPRSSRAVT